MFCEEIGVPKSFVNFTGKKVWWSLFLIKLQVFRLFLVKFAKIFKSTYFEEHLRATASKNSL